MDTIPNDCIYELLLLLNPKQLQLCGQINNNFNQLYQFDSLWRNRIEDKYNILFKKKNYYENCKLYYQLNLLNRNFTYQKYDINQLYKSYDIGFFDQKLTKLPKNMGILITAVF